MKITSITGATVKGSACLIVGDYQISISNVFTGGAVAVFDHANVCIKEYPSNSADNVRKAIIFAQRKSKE